MCQEVFKVVQSMDLSQVETKMALQCAPVITGIKISNLFITVSDDEDKVYSIFRKTEIIPYCLLKQKTRTTYLLFRMRQMIIQLNNKNVKAILKKIGYKDFSLGGILRTFQKRYETYMNDRKNFPHEMGILLGYPIEDVIGFIEQEGKNYLYAGYWKVYSDVNTKKKLFAQYENAKEELILWLEYGYEIHSVIQMYCIQ